MHRHSFAAHSLQGSFYLRFTGLCFSFLQIEITPVSKSEHCCKFFQYLAGFVRKWLIGESKQATFLEYVAITVLPFITYARRVIHGFIIRRMVAGCRPDNVV